MPHESANFAHGKHGPATEKTRSYGLRSELAREAKSPKGASIHPGKPIRAYYERPRGRGVDRVECSCSSSSALGGNVAFSSRLASSRRQARQIVRHGHVEVMSARVNIPSVPKGRAWGATEIKISDGSKKKMTVLETSTEFASNQQPPRWLQWTRQFCLQSTGDPKREA